MIFGVMTYTTKPVYNSIILWCLCLLRDVVAKKIAPYGWMTTTQIKFLVAIQDAEIDGDIVGLLRRLHQTYVEYRLNPLGQLTGPIQSKRFDEKVRQTIESYNRSVM